MTSCWLKELLMFCNEENLTIQDNSPKLANYTTQDQFLMQAFLDASFSTDELILRLRGGQIKFHRAQ
jgi:hypothetical protein